VCADGIRKTVFEDEFGNIFSPAAGWSVNDDAF
jgi:hypothetical protein